MKNMKKFFETPKKAFISIICIFAVLAILGTGTVFAASAIAENSSIGEEAAQNFAFADAGVDPTVATITGTEFTYKHQQFVYQIKFIANDTKYKYLVKASDGTIIQKEMEVITITGKTTTVTAHITIDEAKDIALKDAQLTALDVTFTKTKLDFDNNISVYEIEFYTQDTEYEYEVNASTGMIYSKKKKLFTTQANSQPTQDAPTVSDSQPDTNEPQQTIDEPQQTINEPQTTINTNEPQQTVNTPEQNTVWAPQDTNNTITLEAAKDIAVSDANVSLTDVTFTKTKLDYDHNIGIYEIEFYTSNYKYEYDINAATGAILDKDLETYHSHAHHSHANNTSNNTTNNTNSNSYIDVDNAKSIAVSHAGLSLSDVTFVKAKLDYEDGMMVYEIEFYNGRTEYEYIINATTGSIIEFEIE